MENPDETASDGRCVTARGHIVRGQRKAKGWNVQDLAKKAGYSVKTIERVEKGLPVYIATLSDVANALGMRYELLLADPPLERGRDYKEPIPAEDGTERRLQVVVKIEVPYYAFVESERLEQFLKLLQHLLPAKEQITKVSVEQGSVILTLSMAESDVYRLCEGYLVGRLNILEISEITIRESEDGDQPEWMRLGMGWIKPGVRTPALTVDIPKDSP